MMDTALEFLVGIAIVDALAFAFSAGVWLGLQINKIRGK